MATVIIDRKGLQDDILKYMKTYSKTYTKFACQELTKKAKSCIEMFYDDYTPKYYDRTFDLRDNSVIPYFHNNGNTYYGGVRITADYMSKYYSGGVMNKKATDPIEVAQLAWHGWHGDPTGYNGHFEPIRTTPPLDVLREYAKNKNFITFAKTFAEKTAKKGRYKSFYFE